MFKVDMAAIVQAGKDVRLMANAAKPANLANAAVDSVSQLAGLAALAISQQQNAQPSQVGQAANDASEAALLDALLDAAMRVCDHHDDGPAAREQMRAECLETPSHLRYGLLEHFRQQYPTR